MTNATPGPVEVELKPCPFCGGEAVHEKTRHGIPISYWIKCRHCCCCTTAYSGRKSAITAWNTRHRIEAARPVQSELVEALRQVTDDLEAEIEGRRDGELPRRIERDLDIVRKARALLAKATGDGL